MISVSDSDAPAIPDASSNFILPAQPAPSAPGAPPETTIERRSGWHMVDFAELWRCREMLYFLVWRDVKVRYKETMLGAAWVVLQPLATMIVFAAFFGRLDSGHSAVPYPLFVFAGLLPWLFFSSAITGSAQSIVAGQRLITKVYFPRLFIPLGSVGSSLVDFSVSFGLFGLFLAASWIGKGLALPGWNILLLPLLILGLMAAAIGVGSLLAALTVAYRDFRHATPFLVQLWMFATPSIFLRPETLNPRWHSILPLNPAYGMVASFRAVLLGSPVDWYALSLSSLVAVGLLLLGCLYFRRVERDFADIL